MGGPRHWRNRDAQGVQMRRLFVSAKRSRARKVVTLLVVGSVLSGALPALELKASAATVAPALVLSAKGQLQAQQLARHEHHRVQVLDLDTEFSTTWANPNGTFSETASQAPVRLKDDQGNWQAVSNLLTQIGNSVAPFGLNPLSPVLSSVAGSTSNALVTVGPDNARISITPVGVGSIRTNPVIAQRSIEPPTHVNRSNAIFLTSTSLKGLLAKTSPYGDGNVVEYPNALGPSSLAYQLGSAALTEDIVVPNRAAAGDGVWTFNVSAPAYEVTAQRDGSILFHARSGNHQDFLFPPSFAYDSSGDGTATGSASVSPVRLTLTNVGKGKYAVAAVVPLSWLNSRSRVWPIAVDPTVSPSNPNGTSYRADGTTQSITYGYGVYYGNPNISGHPTYYWRSVAGFNMSGLTTADTIDSATVSQSIDGGTANCYTGYLHTPSAGSYAGANYGTAVSSVGVCSSGTFPTSSGLVSWLQGEIGGSGFELGFVGTETSGTYTLKEAIDTLNITYDAVPSAPTVTTAPTGQVTCTSSSGSTSQSSPAFTSTNQPVVCLNATDAISGTLLGYNVSIYSVNNTTTPVETFSTPISYTAGTQIPYSSTSSLPDGEYYWVAKATNGVHYSTLSAANYFTVDTTPPSQAGVSCQTTNLTTNITVSGQSLDESLVPSGGVNVSCTFTGWDVNMKGYEYQFDANAAAFVSAAGTATNEYPTTETFTIPLGTSGEGLQAISVYGVDSAGNDGGTSLWTLDVGLGMSQPFANSESASTFPIEAVSPSGTSSSTTAKICWTLASNLPSAAANCGTNWYAVASSSPLVTVASTGSTWTNSVATSPTGSGVITPVPSSGYANPYTEPSLLFNAGALTISGTSIVAAGPQQIDIETCFTTSGTTTCTSPVAVTVLAHGFGGALGTSTAGPGQVALSTGEFSMSATDAKLPGYYDNAQLDRRYSSHPGTLNATPFGPGWATSDPYGNNLANANVVDNLNSSLTAGSIALATPQGTQYVFPYVSSVSQNAYLTNLNFTSVGAAEAAQLTASMVEEWSGHGSTTIFTFQVTDSSGTVTSFYTSSSTGAPVFPIGSTTTSVSEIASAGGTTVDEWFNGSYGPAEVISAMPAANGCPVTQGVTITRGCRALNFDYFSGSSATSFASYGGVTYYNYPNQISEIDQTQWDPYSGSSGAVTTLPVACYGYNSSGYLTAEWDPRFGLAEGSTPTCSSGPVAASLTTYGYTLQSSGATLLASVASPGTATWTMSYDSQNRLSSVAHTLDSTDQTSGSSSTASTTFEYGISIAGDGTNAINLTNPSAWSQNEDVPVTGVAIFGPGTTPSTTDFQAAAVDYLDGFGRVVDTASYGDGSASLGASSTSTGWAISAQQYGQLLGGSVFNAQNNVMWSLDANGFVAAMLAGSSASASTAENRASLNFYNSTETYGVPLGAELTDSYGPLHNMSVGTGVSSPVLGRSHTHYVFGLDSPATYDTYTTPTASFSLGPNQMPWQLVTQTNVGYSITTDPTSLSPSAMATDFASTASLDYRVAINDFAPIVSGDGDPKQYGTPSMVCSANCGAPGSIYPGVSSLPSGADVKVTRLNADGMTIERDQPLSYGASGSSLGATSGSHLTTYYTAATGSSPCNGHAEWAGLVCQVGPGSTAPSVGSAIPTTQTTYDWNLDPVLETETIGTTTERTNTTTYDLSGNVTAERIVDNLGDVGQSDTSTQYDTVYEYSATTGAKISTSLVPQGDDTITGDTLTSTSTGGGSISGDTSTSLAGYFSSTSSVTDLDGQMKSYSDSTGSTTTYAYNASGEQSAEVFPVANGTGGVTYIAACSYYNGTDALGQVEDRPGMVTAQLYTTTTGPISSTNANPCPSSAPNPTTEAATALVTTPTYLAAYDANGNLMTEVYPNDMVATSTYDAVGQVTNLQYTQGLSSTGVSSGTSFASSPTSNLLDYSRTYNEFGDVMVSTTPETQTVYAYDAADHLVGVGDNVNGSCYTRVYGYDADSNRTSYLSAPTTMSSGYCPTTASIGSTSTSDAANFDTNGTGQGDSDRIVSSTWTVSGTALSAGNYAYDALGRQTTLPGVDTGLGATTASNVNLSYNVNDQVASMTQGSASENFTYDPEGNTLLTTFSGTSGVGLTTPATENHYDGSGLIGWTDSLNSSNAVTSSELFGVGIDGANSLGITTNSSTQTCLGSTAISCSINLDDIGGNIDASATLDVSGSINPNVSVTSYSEQTEFGLPQVGQSISTAQFAWMGSKERAENNLSGLVLMGARVYNPSTGLFTSGDPIYGGNANPYTYPSNPMTNSDTSGENGCPWWNLGCDLVHAVSHAVHGVASGFDFVRHGLAVVAKGALRNSLLRGVATMALIGFACAGATIFCGLIVGAVAGTVLGLVNQAVNQKVVSRRFSGARSGIKKGVESAAINIWTGGDAITPLGYAKYVLSSSVSNLWNSLPYDF